jgi:hypothetical protein
LNAVTGTAAMFSQGRFVWLLQTDVPLMLLDPGLDGMAGLPNVDLTTLTGHTVHARRLESQVTLHRLQEVGDIQGYAHRLDVMTGYQTADVIESCAHVRQEGNRDRFLKWQCNSFQWVDSPSDLLDVVAILPESGPNDGGSKTSETLVNLYKSAWHYNPEDSHLHTHPHENLKSSLNITTVNIIKIYGTSSYITFRSCFKI